MTDFGNVRTVTGVLGRSFVTTWTWDPPFERCCAVGRIVVVGSRATCSCLTHGTSERWASEQHVQSEVA